MFIFIVVSVGVDNIIVFIVVLVIIVVDVYIGLDVVNKSLSATNISNEIKCLGTIFSY